MKNKARMFAYYYISATRCFRDVILWLIEVLVKTFKTVYNFIYIFLRWNALLMRYFSLNFFSLSNNNKRFGT